MNMSDLAEAVVVAEGVRDMAGIWNLTGSPPVGEVTRMVTRRGTGCISGSLAPDHLENDQCGSEELIACDCLEANHSNGRRLAKFAIMPARRPTVDQCLNSCTVIG